MHVYTDFRTGEQVTAENKKEARNLLNVSSNYALSYVGIEAYDDSG